MELLHLKYFQTAARHEHMTRAAKELSIAQPALSQIISRLEREIGVSLFDRHGRQIRLNKFGRAFFRHVEEAFSALDDGLKEVADLAGGENGSISLAVLPIHVLGDLLKTYRSRHPQVRFRVNQHSPQTMLHELQNGEIDLCITALPIQEKGIEWVPLMNDEIFLIVPQGHRFAERTGIHLRDVAQETFVSLKKGHVLRDLTDHFLLQVGVQPDIAFEIDEPASIRSLVSSGLGISFSTSIGLRYLDYNAIIPVRIEEPSCQRTIAMAWKEGRYQSMAIQDFRQFVIDFFEQLARKEIPNIEGGRKDIGQTKFS